MTLHRFLQKLADAGFYTPPEYQRPITNGHGGYGGGPPPPPGDPDGARYALGALVAESDRVAATPEGGRNHALNTAAFRVGQLVGLGYIAEGPVRDALHDAAHACGLGAGEAEATIRSGLTAGLAHPRQHVEIRAGQTVPAAYTVEPDPGGPDSGPRGPQLVRDALTSDDADWLPEPLDWAELFAETDDDEPDWLVADILERGRSHVIYAPKKHRKSLITQVFCGQLARAATTLYLDLENSRGDIRARFRAMGHTPEHLARLHYFSFPSLAMLDTPTGGAQLAALVERHQAELVVLDTTSRVVGGDENDADTFRRFYRYALVPLKAAGVTVLRLDHAGKDLSAGQRGSSAKGDDVDTVWQLIKHDDDHFTLKCEAQRSGHHPQTIALVRQLNPLAIVRADAGSDPPAIAALVAEMQRLNIPVSMGRRAAHAQLVAAGIKVGNGPLTEAIRVRRDRLTSWEDQSRTTGPELIKDKINNSGPQDQLEFPVTPAQSGPGPLADHADQAGGAPVGRVVRRPWSLVGDQGGPPGPGPVPDRLPSPAPEGLTHPWEPSGDPAKPWLCQLCRLPAERLIGPSFGRQVCPVCAYPDPADRPGNHEEEEN